jgi:hypothetical protein
MNELIFFFGLTNPARSERTITIRFIGLLFSHISLLFRGKSGRRLSLKVMGALNDIRELAALNGFGWIGIVWLPELPSHLRSSILKFLP